MTDLVPCLVCNQPTNLVCDVCSGQYYCSQECLQSDLIYHRAECGEQSIDARREVVEWKSVVSDHVALLLERNWAIARDSSVLLFNTTNELSANLVKWMRVRAATTRELRSRIDKFNKHVKEVAEAMRANNRANVAWATKDVSEAAKGLASFFAEKFFSRGVAQKRDYDQAFTAYAACIIEHAGNTDEAQRVLRRGTADEIDRMKGKIEGMRIYCKNVAFALGAVLSGRPWVPPRRE